MKKAGLLKRIELYQSLLESRGIEGMPDHEALEHIQGMSEIAFSLRHGEGLARAARLAAQLRVRGIASDIDIRLHYLESMIWENMRLLNVREDRNVWDWEQPEIEQELIHLRRAIVPEALKEMPPEQVAHVLSNMAALLNHVGRFCEALECWDRSLRLRPDFPMARGKRGYALTHYAQVLYDRVHVELFLKRARSDMKAALSSNIYDKAKGYFKRRIRWVDVRLPARGGHRKGPGLFDSPQAYSEPEMNYRRWCLEHRLVLNPLGDLGPYPAAARDILMVPPRVRMGRKGRFYQGFFNQLKQAYVSARYLYYEGVTAGEVHFSDADVLLFDTMDFPTYSLSVEKIKASFAMAYSVFDKLARFLNHYLELGAPEGAATFRTIWYEELEPERGLRPELQKLRNWALRGLFWLSKDLYEDRREFMETLEPDARELSEIRYHLERHYLKLHDDFYTGLGSDTAWHDRRPQDSLAYSLHRGDFEAKTLRLLKRVRSALMYLSFGVHLEERRNDGGSDAGEEHLPAIMLNVLDDAFKL